MFRDEAREDMVSSFTKNTEADIRKTFEVLLATAGPAIMGVTQLPDGFMTLEYQPWQSLCGHRVFGRARGETSP